MLGQDYLPLELPEGPPVRIASFTRIVLECGEHLMEIAPPPSLKPVAFGA